MGRLVKFSIIGVVVLAAAVGGLAFFVKFYLTDERVKELVIPVAEKTLDRRVHIGDIHVSLFSGITIDDFFIKEKDSDSNFVSIPAFVLRYDLLPLLRKQLSVSEILLREPTIHLVRDANGEFNYQTLAPLSKDTKTTAPPAPSPSKVLPVAVAVDRVKVDRAAIVFRDSLERLPAVDAGFNLEVSLSLGETLAALDYNGKLDFSADAVHGELKPHAEGEIDFDRNRMEGALQFLLDGEKLSVNGKVTDYLRQPSITADLGSRRLQLDKLLAASSALPEDEPATPRSGSVQKSARAPVETLPAGLTAQGGIRIGEAVYKKTVVRDFALEYLLKDGVLTIRDLAARAYGGSVNAGLTVDLGKPEPSYEGKAALASVTAGELTSAVTRKAAEYLSGDLQGAVNFSGSGTSWQQLRQVLTADGTFALKNGSIKETPVSRAVASLLGLPELLSLSYDTINGTFQVVEGGKVGLDSTLNAGILQADTSGTVGLDGSLDLPVTMHLSPALSEKLRDKASITRYLSDREGKTTLHLRLAGTLRSPRPSLDTAGVQEQVKETVKQKALDKLGETLSGDKGGEEGESTPGKLLKGIFGR